MPRISLQIASLGEIQDLMLVGGPYGFLSQSPQTDSSCPTCGQFSKLSEAVTKLQLLTLELERKLEETEQRLAELETCDCPKSCRLENGSIYLDGTSWREDCDTCSCVKGNIQCRPVSCDSAEASCKNPVQIEGECCPVCLKKCRFQGVIYDHGESIRLSKCLECKCRDGTMSCIRRDPVKDCPPLECPPEEQFSMEDQCCKICPGVDYCSLGHNCHANATCINLKTTHICQCDPGFAGNGIHCEGRNPL
ncbi:unnamed protein product [Cyprideis torosa]|uniref:Uncharacterized protein n=1 Tax=Cyprideis torosa TaxID=163714 RepID=A0A7R8W5Y8_9CRUS|nr:unnamed protein product [Cyprideis torosa]CAG0883451.1 unnamed protein product [Cyprideis torosa]